MATNKTAPAPAKNPQKNAPAPASAESPKTDASPKLSKRVTFWSQVEPSFNVRVMRSLADNFAPPDHGGKPMVRRSGRPAGGAGGKAAKEAREKLLAGMSEEQKLAFLAKEREEKKAKKEMRKTAERNALKEQLRKELEAELAGK